MGCQRDCEGRLAVDVWARFGMRDLLVVAVAWLAYGAGAADDDIV